MGCDKHQVVPVPVSELSCWFPPSSFPKISYTTQKINMNLSFGQFLYLILLLYLRWLFLTVINLHKLLLKNYVQNQIINFNKEISLITNCKLHKHRR